ncbi:phosphomethylpyrimidine synthase ThiC [Desulfobacterium sp. N47]|uniref:Phosphomethylpyrimidine synthase n=1 Tax=uncultured Desulfobacterium sp. TaxID=201089 RepID=E1YEM5_9BACT|nr:Thiamine biosynthesis protein thiC [uncultured Desulfobacterium sp.]
MTQLEDALNGKITDAMKQVAEYEGMIGEEIRAGVATGEIVIPKNINHDFKARGVGKGLKTKINANIGTSPSHFNLDEELKKLDVAVDAGADAVMDLSTGGDISLILKKILEHSKVMIGTVPVYKSVSKKFLEGKASTELTVDEIFDEIENQAKIGVDFVTVHCGITRQTVNVLKNSNRLMGIVSRGGSLMTEWILVNEKENPLYEYYDRLLDIARKYDVTLSLGDGLRPGTICDAEDRAQICELVVLGELAQTARKAGVQVMIEGPGHVPLNRIAADMKLQKRLCGNAPYYVLGPLPTDIAPGYDHIVSAIGGAIAAANGADFLCYVTPAEHLSLPTIDDVREGVIASKIAAHIGDIEKGIKGAWERNEKMSHARKRFDWKTMFELSIDPVKACRIRNSSEDKNRDVCTMCGDMCALKTYERAMTNPSLHKK